MYEERLFEKILAEIAREENLQIEKFSEGWALEISGKGKTIYLYGYNFPHNSSASAHICDDKALLSDLLQHHHIPHVPHFYFVSPNNVYTDVPKDDPIRARRLLREYGSLVCKPNSGTGGLHVYRVETQPQLEQAYSTILQAHPAMAVSPYREILHEYRLICYRRQAEIIYEKVRPSVVGNGSSTVTELIRQKTSGIFTIQAEGFPDDYVVPEGKTVRLQWKHNLGLGSVPIPVTDPAISDQLQSLAMKCIEALDLHFVSIDIIFSISGYEILEINSGIMMEKYAAASKENAHQCKELYRKAVLDLLR